MEIQSQKPTSGRTRRFQMSEMLLTVLCEIRAGVTAPSQARQATKSTWLYVDRALRRELRRAASFCLNPMLQIDRSSRRSRTYSSSRHPSEPAAPGAAAFFILKPPASSLCLPSTFHPPSAPAAYWLQRKPPLPLIMVFGRCISAGP